MTQLTTRQVQTLESAARASAIRFAVTGHLEGITDLAEILGCSVVTALSVAYLPEWVWVDATKALIAADLLVEALPELAPVELPGPFTDLLDATPTVAAAAAIYRDAWNTALGIE